MGKPLFFIFDVETSGLDAGTHEILSFSARLLDRDLLEVSSMLQYAYPDKDVDPEAARINGYTRELWTTRFACDQQSLFEQIRKFLSGQKRLFAVGHNVTFDLSFLKALFTKFKAIEDYKSFLSYHAIDTLGVSLMVDIAQRSGPQGSYSLTNLTQRFGISLGDKAHDVEEDVKATVALFKFMVEQIRGNLPLPEVGPPIRKTPFLIKTAEGHWQVTTGKHKGKSLAIAAADKGYLRWILDTVKDLNEEAYAAVVALHTND
jgi:DNA polymerase III epsilon subunit-like protein